MSRIEPRPHQVDALADLVRAFALHERVQLVQACGTGKTLIGRWHAEASDATTVLVLVPSLALLAQTLQEWRRAAIWPFQALVVCSDPTTSTGVAERAASLDEDAGTAAEPDWATVRAGVTTDSRSLHGSCGRAARTALRWCSRRITRRWWSPQRRPRPGWLLIW